MQATNQRDWQARVALMLILGVSAAAACLVTLMWWKAPAASGQEEPSPTGANFVVRCGFSHEKQVDPIVNPGPSGTPAHHMHHFFGNRTTDSNSTLVSLQNAQTPTYPATTCEPRPGTKFGDTAAYWIPKVSWRTASTGKITPLKASQTFFYYRAGLKNPDFVKPFPPGLKIVTVQGKNVEWRCANGTWSPTPPTRCDNGTLVVRIFFPDCLALNSTTRQPLTDTRDAAGNTLHVPDDHRSHMVEATSAGCPDTHPYYVPRLQTNFLFKNIPTTRGTPRLSSGDYSTMHVDFFNAWQKGTLEDLVVRCINNAPFTASTKPKDCL